MMVADPGNDHEWAIARTVDKFSTAGGLYPNTIDKIIAALDFTMSKSDGEFLVKCMRWRMDIRATKASRCAECLG